MKRPINLLDGLFLLFLYFKLSGEGPKISWFEVFTPFIVGLLWTIVNFMLTESGFYGEIVDRFSFWLWKIRNKTLIKKAARNAHKAVMDSVLHGVHDVKNKAQGNPGQAHDSLKTGKQK